MIMTLLNFLRDNCLTINKYLSEDETYTAQIDRVDNLPDIIAKRFLQVLIATTIIEYEEISKEHTKLCSEFYFTPFKINVVNVIFKECPIKIIRDFLDAVYAERKSYEFINPLRNYFKRIIRLYNKSITITNHIDQIYEGYIEYIKRVNDIRNGHAIETPMLNNEMLYVTSKNIFPMDIFVDNYINYCVKEKMLKMIDQNSSQDHLLNECALCSGKISDEDLLNYGHHVHRECLTTIGKTICPCCEEEIFTVPQYTRIKTIKVE